MNLTLLATLLAGSLFVGMLLAQELGRRFGKRHIALDPEGARLGTGAIDGAVFAMLGLLVAFTFSGAALRFDGRRQLVNEEANAIGTAYLRLDLLPPAEQPALRELFRHYVDSLLETSRKLPDVAAAQAEHAKSVALQNEIWTKAVKSSQAGGPAPAAMLLLPAVNQMIDINATQMMVTQTHPPPIIFVLLFALSLGSSLMAGYGMAGGKLRSWTHMIGLAGVLAVTFYVILDIEYPRLGLIRVDAADKMLVDLRQSMK